MNDALGDRMKAYEAVWTHYLPRRTYTIIRIDGRAFHSYAKNATKPFDRSLSHAMHFTTKNLCEEIAGVRLAYQQSDEISLLLTDFDSIATQPWFGGNVAKLVSLSASIATGYFNRTMYATRSYDPAHKNPAFFDARVFIVPDPIEVYNYFVWRQKDAMRNAASMAAQAHFSHNSLQGLNTDQLKEKLKKEAEVNFEEYPAMFRLGQLFEKVPYKKAEIEGIPVMSAKWEAVGTSVFTQTDQIKSLIPVYDIYKDEEND